ncbi:MAG TPA: hypothetical protein VIN08_15760 [Ohtaekwangia sp.]|uniref:hypothetical protein n=1 Tax=Ohtaekwangia sp. TaxID=2066019 RepID=UPI002F92913A
MIQNRQKLILNKYLQNYRSILGEEEDSFSLLSLEDTQFINSKIVDKLNDVKMSIRETINLNDLIEMGKLLQMFNEKLSTEHLILFSENTKYCGAVNVRTEHFVQSFLKFKDILGEVISIVPEDLSCHFLVDFFTESNSDFADVEYKSFLS